MFIFHLALRIFSLVETSSQLHVPAAQWALVHCDVQNKMLTKKVKKTA